MFVEILRFLRRKESSFYKEKRLVLTCGWCARQYIFVPYISEHWTIARTLDMTIKHKIPYTR